MLRSLLVFAAALPALAQTWGPPPGSQPDYSIIYTGKLFGYYRYPDLQSRTDRGCPDLAHVPLSAQVTLFRDTLAHLRSDHQVLVSMGDNFAPDLLARDLRVGNGALIGKDVFASSKVASDNVACFFRLTGFDALVPGQEDFYYGPERLRQLALFLAAPAAGPYQPVQMLAANLVIRSTVRNQVPRLPNSELPANIQQALDGNSPVRMQIPSSVLPSLQEIGVSGEASQLKLFDCLADPDNPRRFPLPASQNTRCTELARSSGHPLRFTLDKLLAGSNHAVCATYFDQGSDKTHCQLFSVEHPFFDSTPYSVPRGANAPVIFGVLDPTLIGYIGQLNDVWINRNPQFDTGAGIIDPMEALRQVLALCASDSNCKDRRKVLLAQMPYYRAAELAAKLKVFDVVIAQPDQEHSTGSEAVSQADTDGVPFVLNPGVALCQSP